MLGYCSTRLQRWWWRFVGGGRPPGSALGEQPHDDCSKGEGRENSNGGFLACEIADSQAGGEVCRVRSDEPRATDDLAAQLNVLNLGLEKDCGLDPALVRRIHSDGWRVLGSLPEVVTPAVPEVRLHLCATFHYPPSPTCHSEKSPNSEQRKAACAHNSCRKA